MDVKLHSWIKSRRKLTSNNGCHNRDLASDMYRLPIYMPDLKALNAFRYCEYVLLILVKLMYSLKLTPLDKEGRSKEKLGKTPEESERERK